MRNYSYENKFEDLMYSALMVVEELLEMTGIVGFICVLMTCVQVRVKEFSIRIGM